MATRWTDKEISLLYSLYTQRQLSMEDIGSAFPGRTEKAIQRKAESLGLFRRKSKGKRHRNFGELPPFPRGSYRRDLKQKFRSGWEANFARYILYKGWTYKYEHKTFNLGYTTYTPDFYIPEKNLYVEVKGKWSQKARNKVRQFKKLYKDINYYILDAPRYNELRSKYRNRIKNWE